jgi:hypothetical protein
MSRPALVPEQRVVRQLLVADPDGYLIRLSQELEARGNA